MKNKKYLKNLVKTEIEYRKYALAILDDEAVKNVSKKEKGTWYKRHTSKLAKAEKVLRYLSDK